MKEVIYNNRSIEQTDLGAELNADNDMQDSHGEFNETRATTVEEMEGGDFDYIRKMKALQRLFITRIQIFSTVILPIRWDPTLPTFLLDIVKFFGSLFRLDITGSLSSPDCLTGQDNNGKVDAKWWFDMTLPFVLIAMFGVWYHLSKDRATKNTVAAAGTDTFFVWFFSSLVTNSLKQHFPPTFWVFIIFGN